MNKIAAIIESITKDLKEDNDSAERRAMVQCMQEYDARQKILNQPIRSTINPRIFRSDKR